MSDKHVKGLLPSDTYNATIRQSYQHEDTGNLTWCWTVNTGDFAWRNLIDQFDMKNEMYKVSDICERLNFEYYAKDHKNFFNQFVGLDARLKVDVDLNRDHRYKQNIILEYMLPIHGPEFDVTSEKDSSHFHANKKERSLPI